MQEKSFKNDVDRLIDAFMCLEDKSEYIKLFDDIFTIQELHSISQRLKVAMLLNDGMTCQSIANETKASTATISRVNKCLNYGTGGYKVVLERLENEK